jgi:DNA replication and repair protein RecF
VFVAHVGLTDFRNYETLELELRPGPNLVVGSNGQGKTNLVEALGYLATLGSHRVSTDAALIRQGADAAIVRARLRHGERQVLVELQLNRAGANRAQVNRSVVKPRELPRSFSSVLFAPEDLALVRGEPSVRRRFMDELLTLRTPRLAGVLADYDRVLRQRNTLLKSARAVSRTSTGGAKDLSTLDIWDERLVALGSELIEGRSRLVTDLSPEVGSAYAAVAGADHRARLSSRLSIHSAHPDDDDADAAPAEQGVLDATAVADDFRAALVRVRRSELDRGLTLVGPHRDDLVLELNGMAARITASHGESWSFALALRLASAELLRRDSIAGDPVLMLDDVFAELDEARRDRLADAVGGFEQVLITAAVRGDVPERLAVHVVGIHAGALIPDLADTPLAEAPEAPLRQAQGTETQAQGTETQAQGTEVVEEDNG